MERTSSRPTLPTPGHNDSSGQSVQCRPGPRVKARQTCTRDVCSTVAQDEFGLLMDMNMNFGGDNTTAACKWWFLGDSSWIV